MGLIVAKRGRVGNGERRIRLAVDDCNLIKFEVILFNCKSSSDLI
jgi:hypothetical protein